MTLKVNYNNISPVYNERYKVSPLDGVKTKLISIIDSQKPSNILEVGCGTGHWLNILFQKNYNPIGADYSYGMLQQAIKENRSLHLINSNADSPPFKQNNFDLIYCINAIHHFPDAKKFINDSMQLLNKNGMLLIIGFDPHDKDNEWYLYKYFSSTYQVDLKRIPSFSTFKNWLHIINFKNIKTELVHNVQNDHIGNNVFNDHFLDKRGSSQLALLSDEEYQKGINKMKNDLHKAEIEGRELVFKVKLNFYSISGIK